jgi:hypothetical protein
MNYIKVPILFIYLLFASLLTFGQQGRKKEGAGQFVKVNEKDHHYFATTDGISRVPVMISYILPNREEEKVGHHNWKLFSEVFSTGPQSSVAAIYQVNRSTVTDIINRYLYD